MAVFATEVFTCWSRATFVDLLTMRELVEGLAALAACAFSAALPAIMQALGQVVFLLVTSVTYAQLP